MSNEVFFLHEFTNKISQQSKGHDRNISYIEFKKTPKCLVRMVLNQFKLDLQLKFDL